MTTQQEILLSNGYIQMPNLALTQVTLNDQQVLGTFVSNLAAYGYAPNVEAMKILMAVGAVELGRFWKTLEPDLQKITGADRKMEDFVVYKNFPKEVLEMSQAQYWISQICMYIGFANEYFTQTVQERAPLDERLKLKVLHVADHTTLSKIFDSLVQNKARWTTDQKAHAEYLIDILGVKHYDVTAYGFKENAINLIAVAFGKVKGGSITIPDATDVLRLASVLSGSDAGLKGVQRAEWGRIVTDPVKFKKLSRPVRRLLVNLLEHSKNLEADVSARQDMFRELLMRLHPGDFKAPRVQKVYDSLYKGDLRTFNGQVEAGIINGDLGVLKVLAQRPGEYLRRLHQLFEMFGGAEDVVADGLLAVSDRLTVSQLLKLKGYLRTVNARKNLMYPPKGNWSKVKIADNLKVDIPMEVVVRMQDEITKIVAARVNAQLPDGVAIPEPLLLDAIKIQTNDNELAPYGRGTEFDIPENMTFIRTASYWKIMSSGYVWFDNGWNFFDSNWKSLGSCGWNANKFYTDGSNHNDYGYYFNTRHRPSAEVAAVFSGDPTNTKDMKGRAAQMIDLYLDKLAEAGVRYAVWNVLAFSKKPFSDAEDVLATLQWGEKPQEGGLYEPARAQMVFPLTGVSFTKYVAYIDVARRKLVYMDVNLPASTTCAGANGSALEKVMPAYVEYLNAQPSVYDLFDGAKIGSIPVLYSDDGYDIADGKAYVFQKQNSSNKFDQLDLTKLLA